uniref:Ribonuclease H-like domain, reverse transcriptase, RNA-dependent DNA polymerase n=1 Tax=Tanacetum cinerariifolium TaxID=118510 RepID=A0A699J761_TANCI|nr:ribonuclease H-like domain, reverse transcriptase, RNA-dependent DNA polymerase [Tanacetum cinerariifolium]
MSSLFADTYNVVAILEKSDAAEGFEQIIDFLSGSYIDYALTVNPHIYISLCLPNEEIFAGLAQMGYEKPSTKLSFYKAFFSSQWKFLIHTILQSLSAKRTYWNEVSTAMASAVICLSKGQKFNFSKYIFDSLVGKGFSGVETPLFEGMLAVRQPPEEGVVEAQVQADDVVAAAVEENVAEDVSHDAIPSPPFHVIPSLAQEPSSPPQQPQSSPQAPPQGAEFPTQIQQVLNDVFNQGRMIDDMDKEEGIELVKDADIAESKGRHAAEQAKIYNLDLDHSSKVLSMQEDSEVQEVVEVVTTAKLITDVVIAASQVSAASATISAAKPSIPAAAPTVVAAYTRKRKGVIIRDPEKELSTKTPAETPKVKDKGKGILVETPKPMKKKDQIELDAKYTRKLHEEINKDHEEFNKAINWDAAMDHVNKKSKNPQKHLEVVDDEDDDVFIEATSLVRKVPVVDYQIVLVDNKPRFKIIKADETHQLYISFTTLLKNFDREDLENLWGIVKDRFSTSKPTNFSDEYLLLTLKTMFEKPDRQDAI